MREYRIETIVREVVLDRDALPQSTNDRIWEYGATQLIRDSYASAKGDLELAAALMDKRLAKMYAGTLSIRESGPRDPLGTEVRRLAAKLADQFFRKAGIAPKEIVADEWKAKVAEYSTNAKVIATAKKNVEAVAELADLE